MQSNGRGLRGGRPRELLLIGELDAALRLALVEAGATITTAEDFHAAVLLLAQSGFDAIAVEPTAGQVGIDFVHALKEGPVEHERTIATLYGARGDAEFLRGVRPPPREALDAARRRHRTTPVVLLPRYGKQEYAVIVLPPHASTIENVGARPVVTTLLSVTAEQLLARAEPLA